jgi:hypothetical protein
MVMPYSGQSRVPPTPQPWLVLPQGWDAVWTAAKAAAQTTPAWLVAVDNSVLSGAFANVDWNVNGCIAQLRTELLTNRGFALYGDFWSLSMSVDFSPSYVGTPPWVINDTTNRSKSYSGYAGGAIWNASMANPAATFTTPYACTAFDFLWQNPYVAASNTWTYTVDGGPAQTIVTPASSSLYLTRTRVTGLANTTHTIVITTQSTALTFYLYGIATYPFNPATATGLGFANCHFQGQQALDFINSGNQPQKRYQIWQGAISGATPTGFGFPAAASLYLVELGLNDCSSIVGADLFETSLSFQIRAMRRAVTNCSILIIAASNPDGITSDVTSNLLTNPASWGQYVTTMQRVAAAHNCAFLNVNAKWGSTGVAQGFQQTNNIHPTQAGHNDLATLLKSIL